MEQTTEKRGQALGAGFDFVSSMIMALLTVALVFLLAFRVVAVNGSSMCDTLHDGDRLALVSRFYTVQRGSIIVINRQGDEPLIKRVVAVAGDTVDIDPETQHIVLNGEVQEEAYVKGGVTPNFGFEGPFTVPEGYVFAMGDNRSDSKDSRQLGAFSTKDIVGKVALRFFPFATAAQLENGE